MAVFVYNQKKCAPLTWIEEDNRLETAVLCTVHMQTGHLLHLSVQTAHLLHEGQHSFRCSAAAEDFD